MTPLVYALATFGIVAVIGVWPMRKLVEIVEGQRAMQSGAPSLLRRLRGWSFIAIWGLGTLYAGTFLGDWARTGDLSGASDRALSRLRIVVEVIAMFMASDQ
ncbi:MAG TPA: hypothetical protein VKN37_02175 [Roseovarius sp.]|nr:hypothetical protein [Roseovarius sp.]